MQADDTSEFSNVPSNERHLSRLCLTRNKYIVRPDRRSCRGQNCSELAGFLSVFSIEFDDWKTKILDSGEILADSDALIGAEEQFVRGN